MSTIDVRDDGPLARLLAPLGRALRPGLFVAAGLLVTVTVAESAWSWRAGAA